MWGMGTRVPTRLEKRIFHALFFFLNLIISLCRNMTQQEVRGNYAYWHQRPLRLAGDY